MKNAQIKITLAQAIKNFPISTIAKPQDEKFIVLYTFDFSRDANGNTINKYRAYLHTGDEKSVLNNYTGCRAVPVLTSPYRREQSHQDGASAALYHLGLLGWDLDYVTTQTAPDKKRAHRIIYRVKNAK